MKYSGYLLTFFVVLLLVAYEVGWNPAAVVSHLWFAENSDKDFATAYALGRSGIQVRGQGTVARILPDDSRGIRHQKFIVQLASGQTILIAHNLHLSKRVPQLRVGNDIEFCGIYEWKSAGGTVHWTHRDPKRKQFGGWLMYDGEIYR